MQNPMSTQKIHAVYILQCSDGSLYTGYTTDVHRRVTTHNTGKGARYTRARLPVALLASWPFSSKSEALRVERTIKRLSRAQKLYLIEQGWEQAARLYLQLAYAKPQT